MTTISSTPRIISFGGTSLVAIMLSLVIALSSWIHNASAASNPYALVHAFQDGSNDGANPSYGSTPIISGTTLYGFTGAGGSGSYGTVFKISTSGSGVQVLHGFNGYYPGINSSGSKDDGAVAWGTPVLLGSTLYGMTTSGGSNGVGTVFKVNTDGNGFQLLHFFGDSPSHDGANPQASLVSDGSFLYGMTLGGGSNFGAGTVFKIGTDGGGYQRLYDFGSDTNRPGKDGSGPQGSLVLDGTTLYGMTAGGGSNNNGTVFSIQIDGNNYQVLHDFNGVLGSGPIGSLTVAGTTLYGVTRYGGSGSDGTIFKINTDGGGFQVLHHFDGYHGSFPFGDVTISGSTLYGLTSNGGTNLFGIPSSGGSLFQIGTDGNGYQVLHAFLFPITATDGATPMGSLLLSGTKLFGMTNLGGSTSPDAGCIFSFDLSGGGGGGGGGGSPSLSGTLSKVKDKCKTKNNVTTCKLGAGLAVLNSGDGDAPATHIRFFLSTDTNYDDGVDTLLGESTTKIIKPGKTGKGKLKAETGASSAGQYILAVDDDDNVLASFQVPAV